MTQQSLGSNLSAPAKMVVAEILWATESRMAISPSDSLIKLSEICHGIIPMPNSLECEFDNLLYTAGELREMNSNKA